MTSFLAHTPQNNFSSQNFIVENNYFSPVFEGGGKLKPKRCSQKLVSSGKN